MTSRSTIRRQVFAKCIDTFLKLKTEASGYPDWVRTPEDEYRYIANFYASEGIRVDKDAIRNGAWQNYA